MPRRNPPRHKKRRPAGEAPPGAGRFLYRFQNRPLITPFSSTSMPSAAGFFGRPGIVMMLPITATAKPAPADRRTSRTVMVKFSGAARSDASSEKLYCVFATHTGRFP